MKTEQEKATNTVGTFLKKQIWFPGSNHENGTRKGYQYGENLFEKADLVSRLSKY